ncbi:response regulator transcription factor [Shewanella carassii]|uniref:DNA-binding response regulator n=1 Tax=Shewanella carassii TaxID=1987584 RepID=A0ABQ1SV91_9GAMM|nr:response regulator transcription factor [Shewanella carassii]BCV66570.1 DNA-binding response regulator [Shewanella carassii]GGE66221.1 DNA-binding response regulator [Shewanella carassii]
MTKILLVDDDLEFRDLLKETLESEGHYVVAATDGLDALMRLDTFTPDVILLDLMMPKLNGFEMLLARKDKTPVIVISAIDNEEERIKGYELGADDFLSKPFSVKELLVRIQALIRRINICKEQETAELTFNKHIQFDETDNTVAIADQQLCLTQTEFRLFKYLFDRKGQVVTKQELQRRVLKKELGQFDRNLDMHISNTRRKLEQTQLPRSLINTVRGQGYSFNLW